MKKIILLALVGSITLCTQAQGIHKHHPGGMMKQKPGMNMQKLNLTEEQKAQFKSQRENFRKQFEELKKQDEITVKEWKNRMEALRKDQKAKMQALFTPEQKAQMEKMRSEHMAMREVDAKARMEKMKIHLGLSNDQVAKLNQNRMELGQKMKALHENKSIDMEKKKEQMKELMKLQKDKMKSIFTAEQLKKMQEEHKMHRPKKEAV